LAQAPPREGLRESEDIEVADAGTVLIAVRDAVLADSLRFSLELEGFEAKLCDELSLLPALAASEAPGCVLLDQDVFARKVADEIGRAHV
jgi:hypothetical protein